MVANISPRRDIYYDYAGRAYVCADLFRRHGDSGLEQLAARLSDNLSAAPEGPSPPMTVATIMSGQPVPVPNTPSAASSTAALPMASLREQIQTERMFASPARNQAVCGC
jgi:hypothetical protein